MLPHANYLLRKYKYTEVNLGGTKPAIFCPLLLRGTIQFINSTVNIGSSVDCSSTTFLRLTCWVILFYRTNNNYNSTSDSLRSSSSLPVVETHSSNNDAITSIKSKIQKRNSETDQFTIFLNLIKKHINTLIIYWYKWFIYVCINIYRL